MKVALSALGAPFAVAAVAAIAAAAIAQPTCTPWEIVPSPNAPSAERTYLRAIHAVAPDNIWVAGESTSGGRIRPFTMRWDGSSWTAVPVPVPNPTTSDAGIWAIGGSGPDDLWAAGHRLYTPTGIPFAFSGNHNAAWRWNGTAWQLMATPELGGGSGDMLWGIAVIAPNDVWLVGDGHPAVNGPQPALAMHWNGSTFTVTNVPIVNPEAGRDAGNPLYDISVLSPQEIWVVGGSDETAVGNYSQIHRWNGSSWTHVPGPTPGFFNQLFSVVAISSNDVWAAGEYWDAAGIHPLVIHWNGSSWTQVPSPSGFLDMVAFGPNDIWGVGGNSIYHYDGTSWSLVQALPNSPPAGLASITALGPCHMWTAGLDNTGGGFNSLVARTTPTGGPACPADWNGDGAVNSSDISAFITSWLASVTEGTLAADFDGDGQVNSSDISVFITAWLAAVQGGC